MLRDLLKRVKRAVPVIPDLGQGFLVIFVVAIGAWSLCVCAMLKWLGD